MLIDCYTKCNYTQNACIEHERDELFKKIRQNDNARKPHVLSVKILFQNIKDRAIIETGSNISRVEYKNKYNNFRKTNSHYRGG